MPAVAPVAALMDAIIATINGDAAQELLGGITARRAYQESQEFKARESAAIFISPDQWRTIGRCGRFALQQHTLNLTISRRDLTVANPAIDADQLLASTLHTLLQDLDTPAGRVVDILGPLTIDREQLKSPGLSAVSLLLDCDVLLAAGLPVSEGTGTLEPVEDSRLTIARNAVWEAIDNWPALRYRFQRSYKTDDDLAELQLRDPAPHELPAVALYWGAFTPDWKNNRMQEWPIVTRATVWVPGDQHTLAERLIEHVFDAIYQAKPTGSTVPYIHAATGYPPRRVSEMSVQTVTLGRAQQLRALRVDVAFAMRSNKDPFGQD